MNIPGGSSSLPSSGGDRRGAVAAAVGVTNLAAPTVVDVLVVVIDDVDDADLGVDEFDVGVRDEEEVEGRASAFGDGITTRH
jgi:hypothetical protein